MSRTGAPPRVLAELFPWVLLPTGSAIDPVLFKDTKFPQSINKTLNHDLSIPEAEAPTPVTINRSEHL